MKENKLINKKGFTLIELLAVIVILALIALIATPIVLNIISDSKQKAKNDSVNGIIDAVRLYYTQNHEMELPATITFDNGGVASTGGTVIDLGLSGENGCIKAEITGGKVTNNPAIAYITSKDTNNSLTEDPSDATRKIFKGATPNNYINLKENNVNVPYRIVSIESDGTIKVIRDAIEGSRREWDETDNIGSMASSGPRLNENNTYCQLEGPNYYGCNAWNAVGGTFTSGEFSGTVSNDASLNTYLNTEFYNKLDESIQNLIVTHVFDTGGFGWAINYNNLVSKIKQRSWQGKIGLITGLDWFNASNTNCTSDLLTNGWYSDSKINSVATHTTDYPCSAENYLYKSSWWWIISSYDINHADVFRINGYGDFSACCPSNLGGVRPTFYLTSNINLTGEGTSTHPFEIS